MKYGRLPEKMHLLALHNVRAAITPAKLCAALASDVIASLASGKDAGGAEDVWQKDCGPDDSSERFLDICSGN